MAGRMPPPNTAMTWSHPTWRAARSQGRGQEEEARREQVSKKCPRAAMSQWRDKTTDVSGASIVPSDFTYKTQIPI